MEQFKSVAVVTASATGESDGPYLIDESVRRLQQIYGSEKFSLYHSYNNKLGLPQLYNSKISEILESHDYICFVHDDVKIQDSFFLEKLQSGHEKLGFDIVGVAGTKDINFKRNQIYAWHTLSAPISWSGCVGHPVKDAEGKIKYNSFGPSPARVITLDGLFISCRAEVFKNPKVRFDEDFNFDFYDMSFCIRCHLEGLKIGTVDISTFHSSHGEGINKESYSRSQEIFSSKYIPLLNERSKRD